MANETMNFMQIMLASILTGGFMVSMVMLGHYINDKMERKK